MKNSGKKIPRLLLIAIILIFAAGFFLFLNQYNNREERIPPLDEYGIGFYNSPKTVANKLGLNMAKPEKFEGVLSSYSYTAPLKGYETEFIFSFYRNRELIEVSARVKCGDSEAAEALRAFLIEELTEVYGSDDRFERKDGWHSIYHTTRTDITLDSGPYGMIYSLYVIDGDLILYFYDQYE